MTHEERRKLENAAQRKAIELLLAEPDAHAQIYQEIQKVSTKVYSNEDAVRELIMRFDKYEERMMPFLELQAEVAAVGRLGNRITKSKVTITLFGTVVIGFFISAWHLATEMVHKIYILFNHNG